MFGKDVPLNRDSLPYTLLSTHFYFWTRLMYLPDSGMEQFLFQLLENIEMVPSTYIGCLELSKHLLNS